MTDTKEDKTMAMAREDIVNAKNTGRPVWFVGYWSDMIKRARVTDIKMEKDVEYAVLNGFGGPDPVDFIGTQGCESEKLFPTKEALCDHRKKEEQARINEIKSQIQTKDDLIAFMFDANVSCCEEYTDWTARKAVQEIALEKWGIELA